MITKSMAMDLRRGDNVHYTGKYNCSKDVGPRGGVTFRIVNCRVSGRCKTWVSRPDDFHVPVKFGLYENRAITQDNMEEWHLAKECPLIMCRHDDVVGKCWRCDIEASV